MIGKIVHGFVTDNNDPLTLGRVKFKSQEYLGGLECPTWAEPAFPCGRGWGLFIPIDINTSVDIFIPYDSDDTPKYYARHPLIPEDMPAEAIEKGYYLERAILKFKTIGYLMFDVLDKVVTILSTDKAHVIATNKAAVSAPRVNLGALDIDDDDLQIVRKKDLQKAISDMCSYISGCCYPGSGASGSQPTAQASTVTYSE
jgi:hypothetical protein